MRSCDENFFILWITFWFIGTGILSAKPCPEADLTPNGIVEDKDLRILARQWLASPSGCIETNKPDIDFSGTVNFRYYTAIAKNWEAKGDFLANRVFPSDVGNDADGIQAAIDSGKSTVYLTHGGSGGNPMYKVVDASLSAITRDGTHSSDKFDVLVEKLRTARQENYGGHPEPTFRF